MRNRVPDELWTEVRDIVQETGIKNIPMEKKCKKAKWLSKEGLQIAGKRREVKSKGEKEKYKHLKSEFQRIAKRDKKAFLSYQCKEVDAKILNKILAIRIQHQFEKSFDILSLSFLSEKGRITFLLSAQDCCRPR